MKRSLVLSSGKFGHLGLPSSNCNIKYSSKKAINNARYLSSSNNNNLNRQQQQQNQASYHNNKENKTSGAATTEAVAVASAAGATELPERGNLNQSKTLARLENLNLWVSIETIKKLGHRFTQLDPLNLKQPNKLKDLAWNYSLIEELKSKQDLIQTNGFLETRQPFMTCSELLDSVYTIYANKDCGLEFAHINNQEEIEWLTSNWEKYNELFHFDRLIEQQQFAKLLLECETFDHFMAAKYPTTKRYGCEGAESMLIVFDEILRLCHLGQQQSSASSLLEQTTRDNKQLGQITSAAAIDDDISQLIKSIGRIDDVIIGMPHRGRLNLLACLLGFEPGAIFNKTRGECELDLREAWMATGDVLSHLSTNVRYVYGLDRQHIGLSRDTPEPINVSLLPNPSHLEISGPMCMGSARGRAHNIHYGYKSSPMFVVNNKLNELQSTTKATTITPTLKQTLFDGNYELRNVDNNVYNEHFSTILPIQVHGDAAVSGQGIIQETLQMSNLPMFTVGGSIHLVVNNQIGYTTDSNLGRSSRYCTDVFKFIEAPILHVNGQNIDSVIRATRLALAYRQKFSKDVVIDLICYRQHGHNEMDEPSFTQPIMYDKIRKRKSIPQLYCDKIGLDERKREQIVDTFKERLQDEFKKTTKELYKPNNDNYRNFILPTEYYRDHICEWQTGCELELLKSIALASVETPDYFNVHPNLKRVLISDRRTKFDNKNDLSKIKIDWATAEILAFGSLLSQNHSVRLAGQDVARGTFSTRHAVLFDQKTNQPYIPLNNIKSIFNESKTDETKKNDNDFSITKTSSMAQIEIANTILSEEAALAYEFGYSIETCCLTIWEAQFGDFFNTSQSIIDTLISSSESKWLKQSPITLLLPHGLDGAGPEHSSSHIERFLQLSNSSMGSLEDNVNIDTEAKTNWSVCFPTLPSQYFHLLRRQVLRPFRKPLIVMSPKVIFRHPDCISELDDFNLDKTFEPVLNDPTVHNLNDIDTIVLCSGKVYFMLKEEKLKNNLTNIAIIRIEELCPFPIEAISRHVRKYPNVDYNNNLIWFQEEHKNQGAYSFVEKRLSNMLNVNLNYIGRAENESPAVGSTSIHKKELEQLIKDFNNLKRKY